MLSHTSNFTLAFVCCIAVERNQQLRVEVLKVIGVVGAVDPYKYKHFIEHAPSDVSLSMIAASTTAAAAAATKRDGASHNNLAGVEVFKYTEPDLDANLDDPFSIATNEDYYPQFALRALMHIIVDGIQPAMTTTLPLAAMSTSTPHSQGSSFASFMPLSSSFSSPSTSSRSSTSFLPMPIASTSTASVSSNNNATSNTAVLVLAIKAVMFVVRSLSQRVIPFLPNIIPQFIDQIRRCNDNMLREALIINLAQLVSLVKQHSRNFLAPLVAVCTDLWSASHLQLLPAILTLIEELVCALRDEFKPHLPVIIPAIVAVFNATNTSMHTSAGASDLHSVSGVNGVNSPMIPAFTATISLEKNRHMLVRLLNSLRIISVKGTLDEYIHIIVPALVRLIDFTTQATQTTTNNNNNRSASHDSSYANESDTVRLQALITLNQVVRHHTVADHASRIIHPFARTLAVLPWTNVHAECLAILCTLITQLGFGYLVFHPLINKIVNRAIAQQRNYTSPQLTRYRQLIERFNQRVDKVKTRYGWDKTQSQTVARAATDDCLHAFDTQQHVVRYFSDAQALSDFKLMAYNNQGIVMNELDVGRKNEEEEAYGEFSAANMLENSSSTAAAASAAASASGSASSTSNAISKRLIIVQSNLQKAWSTVNRSTRDDWILWCRQLSLELLRESPSSALRACSALALKYPPLSRTLLNSSFLSCFSELHDHYVDDLIRNLEAVFHSSAVPDDILHVLLDLAEFMDRAEKALPIDIRILAEVAEKSHAYAKALHYKETLFATQPINTLHHLLSLNILLQQNDAAHGNLRSFIHSILLMVQFRCGVCNSNSRCPMYMCRQVFFVWHNVKAVRVQSVPPGTRNCNTGKTHSKRTNDVRRQNHWISVR